ncbi:MAG: sigma-70 family RNA polymerase sigma factor [Phycisphaerales bacterium]|nr:sigma-70 family RNA polymerase sigma factor [Phycisphaerales bacterium]
MPDPTPQSRRSEKTAAITETLAACLSGDVGAWDRFVRDHRRIILAAVSRTLQRHGRAAAADVDDATQDVFVRLMRDDSRLLRTFDPDRASMSTWLTLVARSVTLDRLRARKNVVSLSPDHEPNQTAPSSPRTGPDLPMEVLTARQRLVLHLLFDRDLAVPDVASILEVDEQTVRSTKHKALSRLREHLAKEDGEIGG